MDILDLSNEVLKDLIFSHLLIEVTKHKYSEDFFSFRWNEKKDTIIYEDVDLVVHGNSCWEDSLEQKKYTSVHKFDDNNLGEFFNYFLLSQDIVEKMYEHNFDDYLKYIDMFKHDYDYHCFVHEEKREEDHDCYYNYNRVRTLFINVDSVLEYLKKINVSKNLNEISEVFHNIPKDNLKTLVLFSNLDNKLPEKSFTIKKMKI